MIRLPDLERGHRFVDGLGHQRPVAAHARQHLMIIERAAFMLGADQAITLHAVGARLKHFDLDRVVKRLCGMHGGLARQRRFFRIDLWAGQNR